LIQSTAMVQCTSGRQRSSFDLIQHQSITTMDSAHQSCQWIAHFSQNKQTQYFILQKNTNKKRL